MIIEFFKYQGTGNDFIIIDDRKNIFNEKDNNLISSLCERKMGIGADGLILLRNDRDYDFNMVYFNSDGYESSMCGNGGRCIISFAQTLNIIENKTLFKAIDGLHEGLILNEVIKIKMNEVSKIRKIDNGLMMNTGSPHYIEIVNDLEKINIEKRGKEINCSRFFSKDGVNVNFVQANQDIYMRTYERGVNSETLSCGTGAVAASIALNHMSLVKDNTIQINTRGGSLQVSFELENGNYHNVWLSGEVDLVYVGEIEC